MEKKFGIFHTVEELNRAAAAQKEEGDTEALTALALENGLEKEDAQDYMDGCSDCLATPQMAAVAKLNREAEELDLKSQLSDWKDYIVQMVMDSEELAKAVFRPEKKLLQVLALGLKGASETRVTVNNQIIKKAGLPDSAAQIGMCGRDELKQIVLTYYGEEKA